VAAHIGGSLLATPQPRHGVRISEDLIGGAEEEKQEWTAGVMEGHQNEPVDAMQSLNLAKSEEGGDGPLFEVFRYRGAEDGLCLGPVANNQFC